MKQPKLSIVTPSLNQGAFIEDAILSVLKQNYSNYEHIIVDGGSTDNTLEILKRYPHLRWFSGHDRGQSDAINKGFLMATGDLVAWLNADDYYLPGAFEAIVEFTSRNPKVDIIYGNCIFVDVQGRFQRAKTEHTFDSDILLYYGCYIPSTGGSFFKRSLFKEGFLLDINYKVVMDYEYFVRLAVAKKIFKYLNCTLAAFRWHSSNQSLNLQKRRQERLRVQRTWSKMQAHNAIPYDILAYLFRVKRVIRKIFNGGYQVEWNLRQFVDQDTRWFASDNGQQICGHLIRS